MKLELSFAVVTTFSWNNNAAVEAAIRGAHHEDDRHLSGMHKISTITTQMMGEGGGDNMSGGGGGGSMNGDDGCPYFVKGVSRIEEKDLLLRLVKY